MYASPPWSSLFNLTQQQLRKVKKRARKVILGPAYNDYDNALATSSLSRLTVRHEEALSKFGEIFLIHLQHR